MFEQNDSKSEVKVLRMSKEWSSMIRFTGKTLRAKLLLLGLVPHGAIREATENSILVEASRARLFAQILVDEGLSLG